MSKQINIKDYTPDDKNFNQHTLEGLELLEKSIEQIGIIEAITVSVDEKIITGNARREKMVKVLKDAEPIIIETDGKRPVVIKRTDIRSGTAEFHKAALLANTTAKKNINLDTAMIQEVAVKEFGIDAEEMGVEMVIPITDLGDFFNEEESSAIDKKENICPHCGKDINKKPSEYKNDSDN
jgi:hypothetical protein